MVVYLLCPGNTATTAATGGGIRLPTNTVTVGTTSRKRPQRRCYFYLCSYSYSYSCVLCCCAASPHDGVGIVDGTTIIIIVVVHDRCGGGCLVFVFWKLLKLHVPSCCCQKYIMYQVLFQKKSMYVVTF